MMSEAPDPISATRVLIALDASLKDLATLELAAALAAGKQVELMTLFIEDQNLLHLAGLPFALEIDPTSARERKLDSAQMERTLRTRSRQLTRTLKRIAQPLQLNYSLKVVRGSYMSTALAAASGMDVIFLKRTIGHYKTPPRIRPTHFKQLSSGHHAVTDAVWVLYNDSPGADRALSMACDIALKKNRELIIVLRTDDPSRATRQERQATSIINGRMDHAHFVFTADLTDPTFMNMLQSKACGLLVMHRQTALKSDQLAKTFLEELECPLALVL